MESTRRQLAAAGCVAVATAALIASFATAGLAGRSGPSAAEQVYAGKVTICHHTQGSKGTKHVTIRVSRSALPAHLRHGDTMGACSTRAGKSRHQSKAHAAKFHKTKAKAQKGKAKGKRGKGKKA
jgi:hypothetical protein